MAGPRFGAALAGLLVCAVALAGLRVEIVCPPNPFVGYTGEQLGFWAKAFDTTGADVTEQCKWTWYFSDGTQLRGNPVAHAFAKAGKYTVTAAAQLKSDSNAATVEGTISDPPKGVGTLTTEQCQMYVKLSDGTKILDGGEVCDFSYVWVEVRAPGMLSGLQRRPEAGGDWQTVSYSYQGQSQHDGATWNTYVSDTWWTWGDKNWQIRWRATYFNPFPPPGTGGTKEAVWKVFNTVVTSGDEVIRYDPDDPELSHPVVSWNIEHKAWPEPTQFDVTVRIRDLAGNVIKTITTIAGLGQGSQEWDGSLDSGGQASKGVYTYTVTAVHRVGNGPIPYCTDTDKAADLLGTCEFSHFQFFANSGVVLARVRYTLARTAGSCWLQVFDPNLNLCYSDPDLVVTAGTHETDYIWLDAVAGTPPRYYLAVGAWETPQDGAARNRNRQPKPAVHRGDQRAYPILAVNWTDFVPELAGVVGAYQAQAGYWPENHGGPCPNRDAALTGLHDAAVWYCLQHADGTDAWIPNVAFPHCPVGHIFDHPDPQPGNPPGYNPSLDLNVRQWSGAWPQLLFVFYHSCWAGQSRDGRDLLAATVAAGAEAAMSSQDQPLFGDGYSYLWVWSNEFWALACAEGVPVVQAAMGALERLRYEHGGFFGYQSWWVVGQWSLQLAPARYGW